MKTAISDVPGIGPASEKILVENGFKTLRGLAGATVEKLGNVPGFSSIRATKVIKAANELLATTGDASPGVARSKAGREQKTVKKVGGVISANMQAAKLKQEKLKQEKLKQEKLKQEKLKKEKLKKEKLKKEKLKKKKLKKKKLKKEKLKKEKLKRKKLKKEKLRKKKQK